MGSLTYESDGEVFRARAHGEGMVKWIDCDNVIYEKKWWRVVRVAEGSDRITIARFRLIDGEVTMPRVGPLPAWVSRLKHRPERVVDMAAACPWMTSPDAK